MNPENFHLLEKKVLIVLRSKNLADLEQIVNESDLTIDQIRRSIEWLKEKKLVDLEIKEEKTISLGKEGKKAKENGLPEKRLVDKLNNDEKIELEKLFARSDLEQNELSAALGYARAEKWITIFKENNTIMIKKDNNIPKSKLEEILNKISDQMHLTNFTEDERKVLRVMSKRPDYIVEELTKKVKVRITETGLKISEKIGDEDYTDVLTPKLLESGEWRNVNFRPLNVGSASPNIYSGRKHPIRIFIDEVREFFVSLGFQEVEGPIVQSSFWNFDALFTPQDHSARDIQDTFYLDKEESTLDIDKQILNNLSNVHENGAETGSEGWGYKWNVELAKKMVMRTHTTCVSVRHLAANKPVEDRVFSVGRVFRNEKVTFKNLVEFHQIEGIVVGDKVTLRDLM